MTLKLRQALICFEIFCIGAVLASQPEIDKLVADTLDDVEQHFGANYASSYLGARIVDHSPEMNGVHRILQEDEEKYMIVPCNAQKKRFTLQLSRQILVGTLRIQNREYFSSTMRNFTLIGTREYPCLPPRCLWELIGSYSMSLSHEPQHFPVNHPVSLRFLRFLWVTSYNTGDPMCTLTQVGVYGSEMWQNVAAEMRVVNSHLESIPLLGSDGPLSELQEEKIFEAIVKSAETTAVADGPSEPRSANASQQNATIEGIPAQRANASNVSGEGGPGTEARNASAAREVPKPSAKKIVPLNRSLSVCEPVHEYFEELLLMAQLKQQTCPSTTKYQLKQPDPVHTVQVQLKEMTEFLRAVDSRVRAYGKVQDQHAEAQKERKRMGQSLEQIAKKISDLEHAHQYNKNRIDELASAFDKVQANQRFFLYVMGTAVAASVIMATLCLVNRKPQRPASFVRVRASSTLNLRAKFDSVDNLAHSLPTDASRYFGPSEESEGTPDEKPMPLTPASRLSRYHSTPFRYS